MDRPIAPGDPDGLDRIWAPHRMPYLKGESRPDDEDSVDSCPFCQAPSVPESEGLVVRRGEVAFAVLNLYPYNAGHLLICPYRHFADFTEATTAEVAEIGLLARQAMATIRAVSGAHGFNLGMNQGSVAGAGIAGHLHQHVVPRWSGDANFLPVVAKTKALPQMLSQTRDLLADAWVEE